MNTSVTKKGKNTLVTLATNKGVIKIESETIGKMEDVTGLLYAAAQAVEGVTVPTQALSDLNNMSHD